MRFPVEAYHALVRGNRRGPLGMLGRAGLRAVSWPYGLGVRARNLLFDRGWRTTHRAAVPVVSIGNLSLGGTGKTPCVEYVARFYRELGLQVTILSRGYGSTQGRNDEAMVLEENLPDVPHLQGADRVSLAATAVEEIEAELLVLDDGFQHRRLHRDLDIVLIDATRPAHRDYLFPRGTLREPVAGLKRAGAVLVTRCDQVEPRMVDEIRDRLRERVPGTLIALTEHHPMELVRSGHEQETYPPNQIHGRPVGAFCGIGNPTAFRQTLQDLGATVTAFCTFPDHHPYTRTDVDDLTAWANSLPTDAVIATTQKDWVKLRLADLAGRPLWAVRIGLAFREGQQEFDELLRRVPVGEPGHTH